LFSDDGYNNSIKKAQGDAFYSQVDSAMGEAMDNCILEISMSALNKVILFLSFAVLIGAALARDKKTTSQNRFFHIMPHSHIDLEWYWTFPTTKSWSKEIFDRAMNLFRQNPEFRFTQDQVYLIRDYWQDCTPAEKDFFRQMIKEKRLDIVGGMFVMPEVAEPAGESLIRQILLGQQWLQDTLGVRSQCGWFIDTFGQIPQIPQILKRSGYKYNFFWRDISPQEDFDAMPVNFLWESPDGSSILTHWLPGGYDSSYAELKINLAHQKNGDLLFPFGGDVTRPPLRFSTIRQKTAQLLSRFDIVDAPMDIVHATGYMHIIAQEADRLPTLRMDFNPPFHAADLRGTYDNRIELKKRNRSAEIALYNSEIIATLWHLQGHPYPFEKMNQLWEQLLFTHFHDIIGGSHHDPVYVTAMERLQSILNETQVIVNNCAATKNSPATCTVFNTCSYPRDEFCICRLPRTYLPVTGEMVMLDEKGIGHPTRMIPLSGSDEVELQWLARNVPSLGSVCYRAAAQPDQATPAIDQSKMENEFYIIRWSAQTGDLTSIYDKKLQQELLQGPGNVIIALQEKNPDMEGPLYFTGQADSSSQFCAQSIDVHGDRLGATLLIKSEFLQCSLERRIQLFNHLARIDFKTTIRDFTGGDVFIKVSFPLNLRQENIERIYETPFAATQRSAGHYAAQNWVDCADDRWGGTLFNRGTPGYWLEDNRLEMVLLRSFSNYAYYQKCGRRKGVPGYETDTQTEMAREHGTHEFEYSLSSHAGPAPASLLAEQGRSYNTPFIVKAGEQRLASFLSFSSDFIMTALKPAQNGKGIMVRGYETSGISHPTTMRWTGFFKKIYKANLLEEPLQLVQQNNNQIEFFCAPHEIVTFLLF
jgi:alpha-mannosidase